MTLCDLSWYDQHSMKQDMVVCAPASIQEEEGGSEVPGHSQLHSKFKET